MKKAVIFCVSFTIFIYSEVKSQNSNAGLVLGGNVNWENLKNVPNPYSMDGYNGGFHIGFFYQKKFSRSIGLSAELEYIRKGVQYSSTGIDGGIDTTSLNITTWNLDYFTIKPVLYWQIGSVCKLSAGPYFGILFHESYSNIFTTSYEDRTLLSSKVQNVQVNNPKTPIDFGLNLSISHHFSDKIEIKFGFERGMYVRTLYNTNPNYTRDHVSYNNSYLLSVYWTLMQFTKPNGNE